MELHLCNKNGGKISPPDSGDHFDSACCTPYASAPSSPGRAPTNGGGFFFYSCPASPVHFAIATTYSASAVSSPDRTADFEFSARFGPAEAEKAGSMSSADELFLNGQIRPMKLSSHLAPLLDLNEEEEDEEDNVNGRRIRGRDLRLRDKSVRRRARSMSPLRSNPFDFADEEEEEEAEEKTQSQICLANEKLEVLEGEATIPSSDSASSSRSSSAGRNSTRWVFLKDFLYRSKSEGRSSNKFWSNISFSPAKEKKPPQKEKLSSAAKKPVNGAGKRRITTSPHELHYRASRAQAEEIRRKTYLPYRRGLIGCLGFSSKGYGAIDGFARALNPVFKVNT